jgi:hypothetical protein
MVRDVGKVWRFVASTILLIRLSVFREFIELKRRGDRVGGSLLSTIADRHLARRADRRRCSLSLFSAAVPES